MLKLLDAIWKEVVAAEGSWNPDRSCYDLAQEYSLNGNTADKNAYNFIKWQAAKAGAAGLVLGLPGLAFGAVMIPADLTATTYLQLRMVAVIALLHGWDIRSDRVKTLVFLSLLGSGAAEAIRDVGIVIGTRITAAMLKKVPGRLLIEINKKVGFRLVTKAGAKGAVNLIRIVPFVGGLVSGGLNAASTRSIGIAANAILRTGPGEPDGAMPDGQPPGRAEPPDIDGVAEPINLDEYATASPDSTGFQQCSTI